MKKTTDHFVAPTRSRALDKADITTREALKITREEQVARVEKTARLKAERLAREQAAPAAPVATGERKR